MQDAIIDSFIKWLPIHEIIAQPLAFPVVRRNRLIFRLATREVVASDFSQVGEQEVIDECIVVSPVFEKAVGDERIRDGSRMGRNEIGLPFREITGDSLTRSARPYVLDIEEWCSEYLFGNRLHKIHGRIHPQSAMLCEESGTEDVGELLLGHVSMFVFANERLGEGDILCIVVECDVPYGMRIGLRGNLLDKQLRKFRGGIESLQPAYPYRGMGGIC